MNQPEFLTDDELRQLTAFSQGVPVRFRPRAPHSASAIDSVAVFRNWFRVVFRIGALCAASAVHAQPYIGGTLGIGQNGENTTRTVTNLSVENDNRSTVGSVFAGYRLGVFGIEGGLLRLPTYEARAVTPNYPAYRGLPAGTYPQTADIQQTIDGRSKYLRGNVYLPKFWGAEPYVFAGMAKSSIENFERGLYNGVDYVEFRETGEHKAPLYGLGVQGTGKVFWRVEAMRLRSVTATYHTGRRDATVVLVGVGVRF